MTPDAALDHLAFFVGLRLMGPDARRRLRITLLRHKDVAAPAHGPADRLERLDALLDGRRTPETLQDRLDVALAQRERNAAPFDACFWLPPAPDLIGGGFSPPQATQTINQVLDRVAGAHSADHITADPEAKH